MQILGQESRLEIQMLSDKQGLYVPMRLRRNEFRGRFIPRESDPTKEPSLQTGIQSMCSVPASGHPSSAR